MYCLECWSLVGHYKGCYYTTRRAHIIYLLRRYIRALLKDKDTT